MTRSSPDLSIAWPRTLVWNTNPTLDVASAVPSLSVGTVHRADYQGVAAGGKGTLVIRALTALGGECDGVAPLAGDVGAFVRELLHNEGLTLHISEVSGQTRVAVSVSESNRGRDTVVNGPGPTADDGLWQEHIELVKSLLGGGRYQYFLIAGRPPPTASTTIMAELTRLSQGLGVRTVCDTSSPYFESCLTEKPWLMKVNCHEAAEALRISKSGHELVKEVLERGAQNVILTDGPHTVRGSLEGTAFSVDPPPVRVSSAVGCGDCFLAGLIFAISRGQTRVEEVVTSAIAVASAAAETPQPGHFLPSRAAELRQEINVQCGGV